MQRMVIRNAAIISMDPDRGDLANGDILIEGELIKAVAPRLGPVDALEIDATDMIAIPGFVDTHRHTWQALLRGVAVDWNHGQYFAGVRGVMGEHFTAEDMYIANYGGALEAIDAGITTLYDWSHNNNSPQHADGAIQGLIDAGLRAVFGYGNTNRENMPVSNCPTNFADIERVRARYFAASDSLVTLAFAARGPQYSTMEMAEQDFATARRMGLQITVHAGSGLWGKTRPVARLHERGLLYEGSIYVHCCTLTDEEMALIAASGGHVSLAPEVELNMGQGRPAALKALRVGLKPTLSIDVTTSIGGDMFTAMRMVLASARNEEHMIALQEERLVDRLAISGREVLEFATLQGARACGLDHRIGSITPGKQADIVLIDTGAFNLFPVNAPVAAVVAGAHVGNVDTVMVAGRLLKRHGKLVSADWRSTRRRMDAARDALFARAGVPCDGSWSPVPHVGGTAVRHA